MGGSSGPPLASGQNPVIMIPDRSCAAFMVLQRWTCVVSLEAHSRACEVPFISNLNPCCWNISSRLRLTGRRVKQDPSRGGPSHSGGSFNLSLTRERTVIVLTTQRWWKDTGQPWGPARWDMLQSPAYHTAPWGLERACPLSPSLHSGLPKSDLFSGTCLSLP